MTFIPANLYFSDSDDKHIADTLLYVNGNFNNPLPGTGYWITDNAYANDMSPYWGGWWVAYFNNNNTVQLGFSSFQNIPTEQEILNTVVSQSYSWIGNLQYNSDPSCFNEGTKILCLNKNLEEEYIPIENLRKGDLVKSYKHGYRKIDLIGKNPMINNPEKWDECMYKMEKTEENGLIEDLIVTGGHAILVDDLGICKYENYKIFGTTPMIDNKYLLLSSVSNDFKKLENINLYTYYHFILENNGNDDERFGVWANGILTETPSKNHFTNHKYTLLH
jgi:hypothetical protein